MAENEAVKGEGIRCAFAYPVDMAERVQLVFGELAARGYLKLFSTAPCKVERGGLICTTTDEPTGPFFSIHPGDLGPIKEKILYLRIEEPERMEKS